MSYSSYEQNGTYVLDVTVEGQTEAPVPGAFVTLWVDDTYYLTAPTKSAGIARFKSLEPFTGGKLTAWKHNYKPALADNVVVEE
jgi:hypothetical protein